jgi:hypothetical protein
MMEGLDFKHGEREREREEKKKVEERAVRGTAFDREETRISGFESFYVVPEPPSGNGIET